MSEKCLELTVRLIDGMIEVDMFEPESKEVVQVGFPFSPDEHPEFDTTVGDAIYSWADMMADEMEVG